MVARKLITQGGLIHMYKIMYMLFNWNLLHKIGKEATHRPWISGIITWLSTYAPKVCQFFVFPYIFHRKQDFFLKGFQVRLLVRFWRSWYWFPALDSISTCCRTLVFDNSFVKFEYFKHNTEIVFKSSTIYFLQCMSRKILLWTVYIKFQ